MDSPGVPESGPTPVEEILFSAEATSLPLSAEDLHLLLTAKLPLARNICAAAFAISTIGAGLTILLSGSIPWAIVCGIAGAAFKTVGALAEEKINLAGRIAMEPQLVYWAYPHTWRRHRFLRSQANSVLLTLHSRTGQQLEVSISRNQLRDVMAYLTRHNPSVRIGAYDDTTHPPDEHYA